MHLKLLRFPFLLLLCLFFLQGCKDKEEVTPAIKTLDITDVSVKSVTLNGEVINTGQYPILDYGFLFSFNSSSLTHEAHGYKRSLGRNVQAGAFSSIITNVDEVSSPYPSPTIYARAYIQNEKGFTYGQTVSLKLPSPEVESITPLKGKAGEHITITGKFYTSSPGEVAVTFAGRAANVVEVSPTKIVTEVPKFIYDTPFGSKQVALVLRIGTKTITATPSFTAVPSVYDFAPKTGPVGSTVLISGDNLPALDYTRLVKVYFGKQEAPIVLHNMTEIRATVPLNLNTEKSTISVVIDGDTTILPGEFTLLVPEVTSISPASGFAGNVLQINGTNFPIGAYNNVSVTIGDTPASLQYVYNNEITAIIPQNLHIGTHKVYVTIGGQTLVAPQEFEMLAPSVSDISPTSGGTGVVITIKGVFQPGRYYTVYFGTTHAPSYEATANTIKVAVPASLPPGPTPVSVLFGTSRMYTNQEYTVLPPGISLFSPTSGSAGTLVTLNVANFTPGYDTYVRFGNYYAQVKSYTASSMSVIVPSGITGEVKISVIHAGHTIVSNDSFTVN